MASGTTVVGDIEQEAPLSLVTEGGTGCLRSGSPDVDKGQILSLGAVVRVSPALRWKGLAGCRMGCGAWWGGLLFRAPCLYFLLVL